MPSDVSVVTDGEDGGYRPPSMISVEHLTKRFGSTLAVDDVGFSVERGEVVGFLGPNGAGKSTTIRVLTCYHPATSGTARVAGHDVFDEPVEVRRHIGYLPENVPIYTDLRVQEYLRYRAALRGVHRKARREAVDTAMERCGLVEVRRKLVKHVSRGYRQRVGLADALVGNPPILILDEPMSGLDPNQRRRMKALIRELSADHTILFSSHILAEVADVASRIMIIHNGKLRADGPLDQLLAGAEGQRLMVSAQCDAETLRTAVTGVLPDRAVSTGVTADGWAEIEVPLTAGDDPRERLARTLADQGVLVRELKLVLPTLEQFFAQQTEQAEQTEQTEQAQSVGGAS